MGKINISAKDVRIYERKNCVVFLKTREAFGGLSNMAGGYGFDINQVYFYSAESLYQACRFPFNSDIQLEIANSKSPIGAKIKSRKYDNFTRSDWYNVNLQIMRWVLKVKLVNHRQAFSELLLSTGDKSIVEESSKADYYWGAIPLGNLVLVGMNVLGRLLMELRGIIKNQSEDLSVVKPLNIDNFLLFNKVIEEIRGV